MKARIFLLILFTLTLIGTATAASWQADSAITAGFTAKGTNQVPANFTLLGTNYIIAGNASGMFTGWDWNGTAWNLNLTIISGLGDVGSNATLTVFWMDGTLNLIASNTFCTYSEYQWNGTSWIVDTTYIGGLSDFGSYCKLQVFEATGSSRLIVATGINNIYGHTWSGGIWNQDGTEANIGAEAGTYNNPTTFVHNGTLYMISANNSGLFTGYAWSGTVWTLDTGITSGLTDVGNWGSASVFVADNNMYLIAGNQSAYYTGFKSTFYQDTFMPPTPTTLSHGQGQFWINNTWAAGSGNNTDSYNVSINGSWVNGSTALFYNSTGMEPHGWSNISVYAYNSAGNGTLNTTAGSQNIQITNNVPVLTNISSTYTANVGDTLQIYPVNTDADSDTPTFGNSTTKGIFYSGNGTLIWTILAGDSGTYNWQINVSDGYGGTDYQNFSVSVNSTIPGAVTDISSTQGNFWVNSSWTAGVNTNSYNLSVNDTWVNGTSDPFYNLTGMSPHGWNNITVYGFNSSNSSIGAGESYSAQLTNNAPSTVTGVSISDSSFQTTEHATLSAIATDLDSDNLTVTIGVTGTSFGGSEVNYTMVLGDNNTYTYEYSTTTAGTYSISGIYSLDNYSSITKTTSDLTFTVSAPSVVVSGGGGGGGGSTTIIQVVNASNQTLTAYPIVDLLNITSSGVLPTSEEISRCLTESLFFDNQCTRANVVVIDPPNAWIFLGSFSSLIVVFIISLYSERDVVTEGLLYGILTIMIGALAIAGGLNVFILNYIMESPKNAWSFLTFAIYGGALALIGNSIFHHKTKAEKHRTYLLNLDNPFRSQ